MSCHGNAPSFVNILEHHILKLLNSDEPRSTTRWFSCAVTHNAPPPNKRNGIIAIGFRGYIESRRLLCRIPDTNCLAHEKMLHFMGEAPLPTKRAKPSDWYKLAEEFAMEFKAKFESTP